MPIISIIAAIDLNNAIGKDNKLLYHLPADLARFKLITTGHSIIMGRKTFESLPNGALPNRRNIIITRNKKIAFPGCETATSVEEAINMCYNEDEVFIIGGGQIYEQALEFADSLYLTVIHHIFTNADTFFPKVNWIKWSKISSEVHQPDENNSYKYTFEVYHSIS